MACQKCYGYVHDYLYLGVPNEVAFRKYIQDKHLRRVLPTLTDSCLRIVKQLSASQYNQAVSKANNIARRGRSSLDYYCLLQMAALNFLRIEHDWFRKEIDSLKCFLVEQSFIRQKNSFYALKHADEYLCYMFPRLIGLVYTIHRDHVDPKGLGTEVQDTILSPNILPRPSKSMVIYEDDFRDL
jgi:hypothetical protein